MRIKAQSEGFGVRVGGDKVKEEMNWGRTVSWASAGT